MPEIDTAPHCEHHGTTIVSDFDDFVNGPILDGDVTKAESMWSGEYVSARSFGWTALHLACWYTDGDREGVVQWLLDRGCDIEAEDEYTGWRPLHVCASYGNGGAMRVLLEARCCITALTAEGETPLEIAERESHDECARMLSRAVQQPEEAGNLSNSRSSTAEPETGKTLPDKLLDCKDRRVFEAKQSDEYCESLHRRYFFISARIRQNYDYRVYSFYPADIVNKASLFVTIGYKKIMPQVLLEYNPVRIISYIKLSVYDIQRDTICPLCLQSNRYIYTCLLEIFFPRSDNGLNLCSQLISKTTAINFSRCTCGNSLLKLLKLNKERNKNEIETNEKKREFIQPAIRHKNAPRFPVSKRKWRKSKKTKKGCGDRFNQTNINI